MFCLITNCGIAAPATGLITDLYPNPNNGQFALEIVKASEIGVCNLLGQAVHREKAGSRLIAIRFNDGCSSRLYTVITEDAGHTRRYSTISVLRGLKVPGSHRSYGTQQGAVFPTAPCYISPGSNELLAHAYISQAVGQVGHSGQPDKCDTQPVSQEGSQFRLDSWQALMLSKPPFISEAPVSFSTTTVFLFKDNFERFTFFFFIVIAGIW